MNKLLSKFMIVGYIKDDSKTRFEEKYPQKHSQIYQGEMTYFVKILLTDSSTRKSRDKTKNLISNY